MNKFTRKIDSIFEKYGPDKQNIVLCVMDEFDACWDSFSCCCKKSNAVYPEGPLQDEYDNDFDELIDMLLSSFETELNLERYEDRVNEVYVAYVYVDRSYKIRCVLVDGDMFFDESGELLLNLSLFDEVAADKKNDEQVCMKVARYVDEINEQIGMIDSPEGRTRVKELLAAINMEALNAKT